MHLIAAVMLNGYYTRLAEINSNISNLEHKLELMQLLQTTEGSLPTHSIKKAKTKEQQRSEEEDTKAIAQTPKVEALEGKDDAKSVSASSVAALVDEEEPPATLADEGHMELEEEGPLDEAKEDALDELEESEDQEIEESEEKEPAMEEEESTEEVHEEQISSSDGASKPKTEEATKVQAAKPSSEPGASSQVVIPKNKS